MGNAFRGMLPITCSFSYGINAVEQVFGFTKLIKYYGRSYITFPYKGRRVGRL
jgi:hypothetical protein